MKILVIPQLDGSLIWEPAVRKIEYDKVVFLGNYIGIHRLVPIRAMTNFNKILNFQRSFPEVVTLLLGYDDLYWRKDKTLHPLFERGTFQVALSIEDVLFTNAGVSKKWWNTVKNALLHFAATQGNFSYNSIPLEKRIAYLMNVAFHTDAIRYFKWKSKEEGGHDPYSSPLIINSKTARKDKLGLYHQIVSGDISDTTQLRGSEKSKRFIITNCLRNRPQIVLWDTETSEPNIIKL